MQTVQHRKHNTFYSRLHKRTSQQWILFRKKHICSCQNKDYEGIKLKTIAFENDPVNLPLQEAFYIRKLRPILNSREECSEFANLLF